MPNDYNQYQPYTGFFTRDPNTGNNQDIGRRYITKSYLLDAYPNIASQLGPRTSPGLWSWGDNVYPVNIGGQLGLNDTLRRSSPVQVGSLTNWKQVSGGGFHGASVKTDGTLWTWGINDNGQLGQSSTVFRFSPVQVGILTNWRLVSCGQFHTSSVKTDGTLWTWGNNGSGELGLGNTIFRSSPVQVGSLTNWKQISCGQNFTACVKTDGTLWTWGNNGNGQLGLGNTVNRSSPVQVGTLTNWKQVSCGFAHTACVKTDGTLWAWGSNSSGALGLGDAIPSGPSRSSPVQVGSLTNWKQVSCGGTALGGGYTACVKTDGTLWAWGNGGDGGLGLGDALARSSPVQVGTLTNWKQVQCSKPDTLTTACIKTDGTLWTWGNNALGQLGLGDTLARSSPVQVGSLTYWKQVSNYNDFMFAILDYSF